MDSASSSSSVSSASRMAPIVFLSASVSLSCSIVRSSPSSALMANQRAVAGATFEPRTSMIFASAVSISSEKRICGAAGTPFLPSSIAVFTSSSMPRPLSAEVGTIGHPSSRESLSTSILSPFFSTRSIMLRAMTTGRPSSRICVVKYRLRSRLVASIRLMTTSGSPSRR